MPSSTSFISPLHSRCVHILQSSPACFFASPRGFPRKGHLHKSLLVSRVAPFPEALLIESYVDESVFIRHAPTCLRQSVDLPSLGTLPAAPLPPALSAPLPPLSGPRLHAVLQLMYGCMYNRVDVVRRSENGWSFENLRAFHEYGTCVCSVGFPTHANGALSFRAAVKQNGTLPQTVRVVCTHAGVETTQCCFLLHTAWLSCYAQKVTAGLHSRTVTATQVR